MVSERNRIIDLIEYIQSCGVTVNIGKNKARGNKGFFRVANKNFRIDIAKGLDESAALKCLVHEFAHYIHYSYDKTLKSLDFIMDNNDFTEELLNITVETVPKENIKPLFETKTTLKNEIRTLSELLKKIYPEFKLSEPLKIVESKIKKAPYKYLLKHDAIKIVELFSTKIYTLETLQQIEPNVDNSIVDYLTLRSKQRKLARINNKISKLNKYYNAPTELFARSIELYVCDNNLFKTVAPKLSAYYQNIIELQRIPMLNQLINIYTQKLYF